MVTTINNKERVFQIVSDYNRQTFCNLEDINKVVKHYNLKEGFFTVYEFWNNKPYKVNSNTLALLFKSNSINQEFSY